MHTGNLFNIQRFSLQDGPGLRTTVFLKGCPLSCLWCHNPESRAPGTEFLRLENRCMACGVCGEGERATQSVAGRKAADVEACPTGALQQVGREVEAGELVRELLRDRIFFDQSGGGVTCSGGEPLLQAPFVTETLGLLRREGVHTALDTCGFAPWEALRDAAQVASLVLYDVKLMDEARHRAATGQSNRTILENLEALSRLHAHIRIRVPVIPGLNDDEANAAALAAFLAARTRIRQVDLLPYHRTFEAKFARLGLPLALPATQPPSPQRLEALAAVLRGAGFTVDLGGRP